MKTGKRENGKAGGERTFNVQRSTFNGGPTGDLLERLQGWIEEGEAMRAEIAKVIEQTTQPICALTASRMEFFRERILGPVAISFDVPRLQIMGKGRPERVALARQTCMWLLRRCGWTTLEIGHAVNREHTTISHAMAAIENRMATDRAFRSQAESLLAKLGITTELKEAA